MYLMKEMTPFVNEGTKKMVTIQRKTSDEKEVKEEWRDVTAEIRSANHVTIRHSLSSWQPSRKTSSVSQLDKNSKPVNSITSGL